MGAMQKEQVAILNRAFFRGRAQEKAAVSTENASLTPPTTSLSDIRDHLVLWRGTPISPRCDARAISKLSAIRRARMMKA